MAHKNYFCKQLLEDFADLVTSKNEIIREVRRWKESRGLWGGNSHQPSQQKRRHDYGTNIRKKILGRGKMVTVPTSMLTS